MESVAYSSDSVSRYGLTEVHHPANETPLVDIVFVHGLDGDPRHTWTRGGVFWPAQLLPPFIEEEKARILVYGYDADVASTVYGTTNDNNQNETSDCLLSSVEEISLEGTTGGISSLNNRKIEETTHRQDFREPLLVSNDRIHHHAETLIAKLCADRGRRKAAERPIIFVAHSLGGLVVKRALIYSSEVRGSKTRHMRSIFVSTHGILFFGTPHLGLDVENWIHRCRRARSATKFYDALESQPPILNSLITKSETLQNIDRQFMQLTSKFHIFFFHEGKPTSVNGSLHYMVEEESAAPVIQDVERASIPLDHARMCQFENERSPGFDLVAEAIQRYAAAATDKIKADWKLEQAEHSGRIEAQVKALRGESGRGDEKANNTLEKATGQVLSLLVLPVTKVHIGAHCKRHYIVPRERVTDFMGRKAELDQISAYFSANKNRNQPEIVVLHALGGQGKSQIALEYCSCQSSRERYTGIFWVNATSEALAIQSYARIAEALDRTSSGYSGDGDQIVSWVKETLEAWNSVWLLIFDNYDQPKEFPNVRKFIPKFGQGHVIFTSRNPNLDRLGRLIKIPAMSTDEGVDLLLREYKHQDIQQHSVIASRIVHLLGALPLAIDQARAYIQHQGMDLDRLEDFIPTYNSKREQILSYTPDNFWEYGTMQIHGKEEQNKAINAFTTWEMSLEQLRDDNTLGKDEMAHFLTLSAFFNPTRIEEYLFRHYWEKRSHNMEWLRLFSMSNEHRAADNDEQSAQRCDSNIDSAEVELQSSKQSPRDQWSSGKFWDVLRKFHELSLIQNARRDIEEANFSLHPLIRDWLQLRQKADRRQRLIEESAKIVATSVQIDSINLTSLEYKTSLLSHIDACLSNDERFSKDQHQLGNHIDNCDVALRLAFFYRDQGRYEISETLCRRVATTKLTFLGVEHVETLQANDWLAYPLGLQGNYDEAEKIGRQNLQVAKRVLGEEHDQTVKISLTLAITLDDQGKYGEAEKMYRQIFNWCLTTLGERHEETLHVMNNLAITLKNQGKYEEAVKMERMILSTREKMLSKRHPSTLNSMNNLAITLTNLGEYEEAKSMHSETLHLKQEVLGKKHPETLDSMNNLAVTLQNLRKYEEAKLMYSETLQLRQEVLGKKHPNTLGSMSNLAITLRNLGQYEEAKLMYSETLQLQQEVLGKKHPNTLNSMNNLAVSLEKLKKYEEAKLMYSETLQLRQEVLGKKHSDTLISMSNLANTLDELGENEKAKLMYSETLQLRQEVLGKKHPSTLLSMYNLADLLPSHEEEHMLRETLVLREEVLGRDHPDTLSTRERLAYVLRREGKSRKSGYKFMKQGALVITKLIRIKRPRDSR